MKSVLGMSEIACPRPREALMTVSHLSRILELAVAITLATGIAILALLVRRPGWCS
jgi:hypothetical protein